MSSEIFQNLKSRTFSSSEHVFYEGMPSNNEMFFVIRGAIRLYQTRSKKEVEIMELGPGEFFGEYALINKRPRAASAQAVEDDTRVAVMNKEAFLYLSRQKPDFLFRLLQRVLERIHQSDLKLRDLQIEIKSSQN